MSEEHRKKQLKFIFVVMLLHAYDDVCTYVVSSAIGFCLAITELKKITAHIFSSPADILLEHIC